MSSCRPSSLLGSANKTLHYITLHYITLPPASADTDSKQGPGDSRCHENLQQNPVEDDDDDDTEDGDDDDADDDDGDDDDVDDDEDDVEVDYLHHHPQPHPQTPPDSLDLRVTWLLDVYSES
jgi:hypothetical protein